MEWFLVDLPADVQERAWRHFANTGIPRFHVHLDSDALAPLLAVPAALALVVRLSVEETLCLNYAPFANIQQLNFIEQLGAGHDHATAKDTVIPTKLTCPQLQSIEFEGAVVTLSRILVEFPDLRRLTIEDLSDGEGYTIVDPFKTIGPHIEALVDHRGLREVAIHRRVPSYFACYISDTLVGHKSIVSIKEGAAFMNQDMIRSLVRGGGALRFLHQASVWPFALAEAFETPYFLQICGAVQDIEPPFPYVSLADMEQRQASNARFADAQMVVWQQLGFVLASLRANRRHAFKDSILATSDGGLHGIISAFVVDDTVYDYGVGMAPHRTKIQALRTTCLRLMTKFTETRWALANIATPTPKPPSPMQIEVEVTPKPNASVKRKDM